MPLRSRLTAGWRNAAPSGNGGGVLVTLARFEALLYGVVGVLLAAAATFALVGTVNAILSAVSAGRASAAISVLMLDRVLLALIVAELVHTLRFVVKTHEISAEPFLFIGLIAVVRRILIVTAEFERPATDHNVTSLVWELGLLGFLALALAAAIFLVRRSAPPADPSRKTVSVL